MFFVGAQVAASFPEELVALFELLKLPAGKQAVLLSWLCGDDFGATVLEDLQELEDQHIEHLVSLVPPAKKKVHI